MAILGSEKFLPVIGSGQLRRLSAGVDPENSEAIIGCLRPGQLPGIIQFRAAQIEGASNLKDFPSLSAHGF